MKLTGWQPRITLEKGVGILLDNLDCWLQAPVWTPETIAEATREWFQYLSQEIIIT
jgi:UDP-glucose 4-epimerase